MPLGDFGPAPSGTNLEENQTANIVTLVLVFGAIALFAVILRVVARIGRNGAGLAVDDLMVIVALVLMPAARLHLTPGYLQRDRYLVLPRWPCASSAYLSVAASTCGP